MKFLAFTFILCSMWGNLLAQNIGINTTSPRTPLHIMSSSEHALTLENQNPLTAGSNTSLLFGYSLTGPANDKYTAAIRSLGASPTTARLGLFTGISATPEGMTERISILHNGRVGIGMTDPLYDLDINGNARFNGSIGIGFPPVSSYNLYVSGPVRFNNNLRIDGILNPDNPLNIGNNTAIEGTLTVQNGKGIVRSVSATQMRIKRMNITLYANVLGAGATIQSGLLGYGEDFSSVTVIVGGLVSGTGDLGKVFLVPFNINNSDDTCQFMVTNVSNAPITFEGTWQIILVGN